MLCGLSVRNKHFHFAVTIIYIKSLSFFGFWLKFTSFRMCNSKYVLFYQKSSLHLSHHRSSFNGPEYLSVALEKITGALNINATFKAYLKSEYTIMFAVHKADSARLRPRNHMKQRTHVAESLKASGTKDTRKHDAPRAHTLGCVYDRSPDWSARADLALEFPRESNHPRPLKTHYFSADNSTQCFFFFFSKISPTDNSLEHSGLSAFKMLDRNCFLMLPLPPQNVPLPQTSSCMIFQRVCFKYEKRTRCSPLWEKEGEKVNYCAW